MQVEHLGNVFREKLNYNVTHKLLNKKKPAQTQVNKHLSDFVFTHDRPNTLLIVYYAGHGVPGLNPGETTLVG